MEFRTSVSFYNFYLPEEKNSRLHINNIQSETFFLDSQKLLKNNYIYSVELYQFQGNPVGGCSFKRCFYNDDKTQNCGTYQFANGGFNLRDFSYISIEKENYCESGLNVEMKSKVIFNPTIPTVFDIDLSNILDSNGYKENMAYGGRGDDFKQETISSLKSYNYIFIRNDINKNANDYELVITAEDDQKLLRKGEMFRKALSTSFKANISISSQKCSPENISTITAEPIQMTEENQIKINKFTDDDIPNNCLVNSEEPKPKTSPGIIAAIVIAVVVVVVVVIVVVIIVIKKRRANQSSKEGSTNAENA